MNEFDIYVDSGANIPRDLQRAHGIKVIPYYLRVNGEERCCVEEGVDYAETAKKFYEDMRQGAEVQTSLINAHTFYEALLPSMKAGRDALLFTISSGISATQKQAQEAKDMLEKDFPERRVYVLDSANASMGEGMLALRAAELKEMGESASAAAEWVKENAYKLNSYVTVGDLKYLKKTGRISTTLAIAGTILNIKPIIRADGGQNAKLVFFSKERQEKGARRACRGIPRARNRP